jgi:multidrug transporter EmrE-like cation transporter
LSSSTVLEAPVDTQAAARRSFLLVFLCTLVGAAAQILVKEGTAQLGAGHITLGDVARHPGLFVSFSIGIITNFKLFCGYLLYGVMTFLMALALKGRELSRLFPIIALTYVWVTALSVLLLGEHMNFFRSIGIAFIVCGVSVLGLKK